MKKLAPTSVAQTETLPHPCTLMVSCSASANSSEQKEDAKLTQKQEAFCVAYLETGNASEAYRRSYDASNMSMPSVNRAAKELVDNPKIAARVNQLREPVLERMQVTLQGHLSDLLALREKAIVDGKWSAAVQAEIARGKAAGLYIQKNENVNVDMSIEDIDLRLAQLLAKYKDDQP
jgi:phage terminase small subunit